ncbi:hypothetical protein M3Y96_00490100 [Aphelenchoides besseyi]|nr:hypothetical protein M3Y96_00490100 [Aphelenchoides besseyi]
MDRPGTSKEKETELITEEEIRKDAQRLDTRLANCAKEFNLTSLNVKNIIFHIIKDPNTLAALLTDDPNASETLHLTRSRLKQLEEKAKTKLDIELKPVNASRRTFLDVQYDENDEDDADYQEEEVEDEELDDEPEIEKDDLGDFGEEEQDITQAPSNMMEATLHLDDLDDSNWLQVLTSDLDLSIFEEDDDFNFLDNEVEDLDEFRMDRSTEIPRRELRDLYEDNIDGGAELVAASKTKKKKRNTRTPTLDPGLDPNSTALNVPIGSLFSPAKTNESAISNQIVQEEPSVKRARLESSEVVELPVMMPSTSQSWSLLKRHQEPPRFTDEEIQTLKVQFEKHVQLLTQLIITTTDMLLLRAHRNQATRMMHELDKKMYENVEDSIFHIQTLPAAVVSCHAVNSFSELDVPNWYNSTVKTEIEMTGFAYRDALILSESEAVCYPELISTSQPANHPSFSSSFLVSEQILLSLALFELHHVPHATGGISRQNRSKYQIVSTYFLPNKSVNQIRNHLKNVRAGNLKSPLHQLIISAEHGQFNAIISMDNGSTRQTGAPADWPPEISVPAWLQVIQKCKLLASVAAEQSANTMIIQQQSQPSMASNVIAIDPTTSMIPVSTNEVSFLQLANGTMQIVQPQLPFSQPVANINGSNQTPVLVMNENGELFYATQIPPPVDCSPEFQVVRGTFTAEELNVEANAIHTVEPQKTIDLTTTEVLSSDDDNKISESQLIQQPSTSDQNKKFMETTDTLNLRTEKEVDSEPTDVGRWEPAKSNIISDQQVSSKTSPQRKRSKTISESTTSKTVQSTESEKATSRRLEQMRRCMRGFDDQNVVERWSSCVLETVYNLVKQRLFMHDGKFKTFMSVLSNPKKSGAAKYDELSHLLRDTQPELADCIAALMDEEELRPDQEQNPERCAYKCALEMMMNIHIYFNGQQNTSTKRRLLKLIQDMCFTEHELREEMRKLLAGRHDPLWTKIRQYFRGEKYTEKVDMSKAEEVPLSVFQSGVNSSSLKRTNATSTVAAFPGSSRVDLHFESVDLTTQKADPNFIPLLRQHNGFFSLRTCNGQTIPVNIEISQKPSTLPSLKQLDPQPSTSKAESTISTFTSDDDRRLIACYNNAKGDRKQAVELFCRDPRFDESTTTQRLTNLLELFSCISTAAT